MAGLELAFVEWLESQQKSRPEVLLGIGDDMAMLKLNKSSGRLLISSDMLLDDVHFETSRQNLSAIGRKAVACSLSDCAAMAVRPLAAVVSVAFPADWSLAQAQELFRGMFAIASDFDLAIVGGDTASWDNGLALDVSILATPYEGIEPIRRSGARLGDDLYVTGPLGGSLLGRHLTFTPRVREARILAETLGPRLHAMMDISDGLSLDLWRMCQASDVGATIDGTLLAAVVSEDALRAANGDLSAAMERALSDGEDFELLVAVEPRGGAGETKPESHPDAPLIRIGAIEAANLCLRQRDGTRVELQPQGYVH